MPTMREAAQFFDLYVKQQREDQKRDATVSRKAKQMIDKAAKVKSRPGQPLRINSFNENQQRKTLVDMMQSVHHNRDAPSRELHRRVMNVLKEPKIKQSHMAELKVVVNEFLKLVPEQQAVKQQKEWRLQDKSIWGDVADELEDVRRNGKVESLKKTTKESLVDAAANFLGPAGVLVKLAVELKEEFGEDGKNQWTRLKNWFGLEQAGAKAKKKAADRADKQAAKQQAGLLHTLRRFASKLKSGFDSGWGMTKRVAKSVWRFLGKHKRLAGVAAAGIGASVLMSGDNQHIKPDVDAETKFGEPVAPDGAKTAATRTEKQRDAEQNRNTWTVKDIAESVKPALGPVVTLFTGITAWIGSHWDSFCGRTKLEVSELGSKYDVAMLKLKMTKDDIEETRDQAWDKITKSFSDVWESIKRFLPKRVTDTIIQAKDTVVHTYNRVKESVGLGEDGTSKPQSIPMKPMNAKDGEKYVVRASGADMDGLNPAMRNNLYAMAAEYHQQTGKSIKVNSAKRSTKEQQALYAANPKKAAKPGYSMHEYGYAVDITDADGTATRLEQMGLLQKYGFVRPLVNASFPEPWHVEPIAVQGVKAAIRSGKAQVETQLAATSTPDQKTETEGAPNTVAATTNATVQQQSAPMADQQKTAASVQQQAAPVSQVSSSVDSPAMMTEPSAPITALQSDKSPVSAQVAAPSLVALNNKTNIAQAVAGSREVSTSSSSNMNMNTSTDKSSVEHAGQLANSTSDSLSAERYALRTVPTTHKIGDSFTAQPPMFSKPDVPAVLNVIKNNTTYGSESGSRSAPVVEQVQQRVIQPIMSTTQQQVQSSIGRAPSVLTRLPAAIQSIVYGAAQPAMEAARLAIQRVFANSSTNTNTSARVDSDIQIKNRPTEQIRLGLPPLAASVAPSIEPYQQVMSESEIIEADVETPEEQSQSADQLSVNKTTVDTVPLYLGDLGMLMLNFGMTGG